MKYISISLLEKNNYYQEETSWGKASINEWMNEWIGLCLFILETNNLVGWSGGVELTRRQEVCFPSLSNLNLKWKFKKSPFSPVFISSSFASCMSAVDNLQRRLPSVPSLSIPASCTSHQEVRPVLLPFNQGWLYWLPWPKQCGRRDVLGLPRLSHKMPHSFCTGLLDSLTPAMFPVRMQWSPTLLPANSQHQ